MATQKQIKDWFALILEGLSKDKTLAKEERLALKSGIRIVETLVIDIHRIADAVGKPVDG